MNCIGLRLALWSLTSILFLPMAQAAPQYAAAIVVPDAYSFESVTLEESGYLQATQRDAYGNITSLTWRPEEGWRTIGPWVNPFATLSSQGINVSASNDAGLWAGSRFNGSETTWVAGDASGVTATFPYPSGTENKYMYARSINAQGMVAGFLNLPNNYADGTASPPYIDPETGEMLSDAVLKTRNGNASFVWTPTGGTKVLPSLPETYGTGSSAYIMSEATAVNNLGQVVGTDALFGGGRATAFIWSEASGIRSLGRPSGYSRSLAYDINDNGVVVGSFDNYLPGFDSGLGTSSAFVWTETDGMRAIDTLLMAADKAKVGSILDAKQLNERGQILAVANTGSNLAYVLLTPVPEPTTQGLMLLGLISLCAVVRSKSR
jgi:probable HAF family extracellular repeat protein